MKTILTATLIFGFAITGFCGIDETNSAAQTQQEQLLTCHYKFTAETFWNNLKDLAGTKEDEDNIQMLHRFFKQHGIELKNGESLLWEEKNNELIVQATKIHQDQIESVTLFILNSQPWAI